MRKHVLPELSVLNWIRSRCKRSDCVLDVGCGEGRYSKLDVEEYFGIDSWEHSKADMIINLNSVDLPFPDDTFDVILMIDFVEHLQKYRSKQLIEQAQRICKRELLVMTPIKWSINDTCYKDPTSIHYQNIDIIHKSKWDESDFSDTGWARDALFIKGAESRTSKMMLSYRWMK